MEHRNLYKASGDFNGFQGLFDSRFSPPDHIAIQLVMATIKLLLEDLNAHHNNYTINLFVLVMHLVQ